MHSNQIQKFARVLVDYSMKIEKGDNLCIRAHHPSLPLIEEVYKYALQKGAYPVVDMQFDSLNEIYYNYASDEQLEYVSALRKFESEHFDASLIILGSENVKAMANVDPNKMAKRAQATQELSSLMMKRLSDESLKVCITQFPNQSLAQEAGMSLTAYQKFLTSACFLDTNDPVQKWIDYSTQQQKICDFLMQKKHFKIISKETDLSFCAEGRTWVNCDGHINFPDGEVFTGPIEDSVNGVMTFSFPGVYRGKEVENIKLHFEDGKVVDAEAKQGKEFLDTMLNTDEGARRMGEFAIATNYNIQTFTKNILFDEKIGGTVHMAIGESIPQSGGVNKSAIHWDMVCDMRDGEIYADDELIYQQGKFIVDF